VPIEEDEVRASRSIDHLVDAKKVLDRGAGAAFRPRVERADPDGPRGFVARPLAALGNGRPRRFAPCTARLAASPTLGHPPLLDFRHATTDNELQM
jgi:hypothetical protein